MVEYLDKTGLTYLWGKIKALMGSYLPLTGGTVTGVINLIGNNAVATDATKGINFKNSNDTQVGHIGASSLFGLYSSGRIVIRPNGGTTSGIGLELESTTDNCYLNGSNLLTASNTSVTKDGDTLTVKVNNTSQSISIPSAITDEEMDAVLAEDEEEEEEETVSE